MAPPNIYLEDTDSGKKDTVWINVAPNTEDTESVLLPTVWKPGFFDAVVAPNLFVAVASDGIGGDGSYIMTSPDGIVWTLRVSQVNTPDDNAWRDICYSPEQGKLVVVAQGNTLYLSVPDTLKQILTSTDGITYDSFFSSESLAWYTGVRWSPSLALYCAVSPGEDGAGNGTSARIMTSPDGEVWTSRASADATTNNPQWRAICWSPELALWCAVANGGTGARVITSPDGINWTARAIPENNGWQGVVWSPQLLLFVAVSNTGTNRVMTSPDGINWTARSAATASAWIDVCWSPSLGLYCAVSASANTNCIMTSPDGTNWTTRVAPNANVYLGVCWSPAANLFVAVATTGAGNRVMTSPDGVNWTARASAADKAWASVTWAGL